MNKNTFIFISQKFKVALGKKNTRPATKISILSLHQRYKKEYISLFG